MSVKLFKNALRLFKGFGKPSHLTVIIHDLIGRGSEIHEDEVHLRGAIKWLSTAQDVTRCNGVSAGYFFPDGWLPPYPETTGYIIPTFLQYALFSGETDYIERAVKMGDWEINIQMLSGAVRGGVGVTGNPVVFDTGQVILGWMSLYTQTNMSRFLDAATKAANWLLSIQDADGKWSKHTYMNIPHVYHTRVAWSLLTVYTQTNNEVYKTAAEKQIIWALTQAKDNGWFNQMGFTAGEVPFTHTIAYTLRGLLESSYHLEGGIKQRVLDIVQNASEHIITTYESRTKTPDSLPMYMPARLNEGWNPKAGYSCLTGNAQLSCIFMKLYDLNNDTRFWRTALKLIDHVKMRQRINCCNPGIQGGIAGSYPIWGMYAPFTYPNWTAKFFVDALLMKRERMKNEMD